MNIQRLPISTLKPAPYNPRIALQPGTPAWEKLRRSLREFDLVQPIVWNKQTGHIVGGHQRCEILKHEGVVEVDCVVVDLSEDRERLLNIALNNHELASDWDAGRLSTLLEELVDLPEVDATLTGFDEQQLRDLLLIPSDAPAPTDPGPAAESDTITVTLEVPPAQWPLVRQQLDELVHDQPTLRLHIRLPKDAN